MERPPEICHRLWWAGGAASREGLWAFLWHFFILIAPATAFDAGLNAPMDVGERRRELIRNSSADDTPRQTCSIHFLLAFTLDDTRSAPTEEKAEKNVEKEAKKRTVWSTA